MRKTIVLPLGAALIAGAVSAASAHHSFVMFDKQKEVTLNGTVTKFENTNPHAQIVMAVPEKGGKTTDWIIQSESPLVLEKAGIDDSTLTPGEKVTVRAHPLKAGGPEGSLIELKASDGMVMSLGKHAYGELMKN